MEDKRPRSDTTQELKNSFSVFTRSLSNYITEKGTILKARFEEKERQRKERYQERYKYIEEEQKRQLALMEARQQYINNQRRMQYEQQMKFYKENLNTPPENEGEIKMPPGSPQEPPADPRQQFPRSYYDPRLYMPENKYWGSEASPYYDVSKRERSHSFGKAALVGYGVGVLATRSVLLAPLICAGIFGYIWTHHMNK
eukprot:TRINITY_DN6751_c0_g1_i18.p1 TRINITY_DN6751_c0_g1~~TRINITY_DN6751_c0_g1_i18.p1  ORF type:complete len:199 (-),score=36.49 TRINITY_DN6751_c0_g1_i18:177-773(-)